MPTSTRPLRIAFCRVSQESNAFSALPSSLDDFRVTHWFEGDALLQRGARGGHEAPGFLKNAELSGFLRACAEAGPGIEPVPMFSVWAVPSGPLDHDAWAHLRDRVTDGLADAVGAGGVDGVYLCLHGALSVPGVPEPEVGFIRAARAVVGPDVPIAVSLDLHAVVTRDLVEGPTLLLGYRTNPHRDHADTGRRAGRLLIRTMRDGVKPTVAWRSLPLALGGGTTLDFLPPMRGVFRAMRRMEKDPRVLAVSLFQAHLWATHPELGWAAVVVTDAEPALAEQLAEELAEALWGVRHEQAPVFPNASDAIGQARSAIVARRLGTVCMCDASDVVGAGAVGESTLLLRRLLQEARDLRVLFPFRDALVVAQLWDKPVGRRVDVEIGGRVDPQSPRLGLTGVLLGMDEQPTLGRRVVVGVGKTSVVITKGPPLAWKPSFYGTVGLPVRRADIAVVKSFFPFRLYFAAWNRKTIYAKTRGATDFDRLLDLDLARPTWPKDPVEDWRPADRARRGVG